MGLLSEGTPLHWDQAKTFADFVRQHGIAQLLNIFHAVKHSKQDALLWGDEVEYVIVHFDHEQRKATLSLIGNDALDKLQINTDPSAPTWHPEYARFMLESTPSRPYGHSTDDLLLVEPSMELRRRVAHAALPPNTSILSVTAFPRLGCPGFTTQAVSPSPDGDVSKSIFFPDEAINKHPRFPTLTANIRRRRGSKVSINIPIFHDSATPTPYLETFVNVGSGEGASTAQPDHIYLDAMGFGMGCCCLQMTFQGRNLEETRYLYDQMAVLTPIVLALSAATPILRGLLSDRDSRWSIISASVDDRTEQERGLVPLTTDRFVINKSRYASIDSYISQESTSSGIPLNDIPLVFDAKIAQHLQENGMDELLSRHFAHLFIRDPLVLYTEKLELDDAASSDHFENIQSTNWQTMRFKPPPPNSSIGWRAEFRPTEVQVSDFENAAYTAFVVLLTRTILHFHLNLYIPISKVDENLERAQARSAITARTFFFRNQIRGPLDATASDSISELSIDTIINGKAGVFEGLIPLINEYLDATATAASTRDVLSKYLRLISKRASGALPTTATWIRSFVASHPSYNHDSVVNDQIAFDLCRHIDLIGRGEIHDESLLGPK